jgi:phage regulator Rha-like protein
LLIGDEFVSYDNSYINSRKITEEKRRGGEASYQKYKPLRNKVEELCKQALKKPFPSARELSRVVANQIEEKHQDLLKDFEPYKKYLNGNGDHWRLGTFYDWCNEVFPKNRTFGFIPNR